MESYSQVRQENLIDLAAIAGKDGAIRLQAIARSLHRLDEASCNYGLTPRQEKREENLEREAMKIAEDKGWHLYRQGDPRGWPLYVWSDAKLADYASRFSRESMNIDCCYYEVGTGVCPH